MRPSEYWSMKLVPYALFALSCFLEGFFLAGRKSARSSGCYSQEAGRTRRFKMIHFFSKVEKEKEAQTCQLQLWNPGCGAQETPSEALMEPQTVLVRGLHWSLHYPYDLYSTLIRDADKSTLKLQLTSPSPSLPLHHPSFSSFFPALAEGLKTLILGPTFSLPLFLGFPYTIHAGSHSQTKKGDRGEIRRLR